MTYGPEKRVEQYLRRECADRGWPCVKLVPASGRGIPDRMILLPGGTAAFVELKRPDGKGRLSPAQRLWRDRLRFLGFASLVVSTPAEVDALLAVLDLTAKGKSLKAPDAPTPAAGDTR